MISQSQQQLLSMPFELKEHSFYNGMCYLAKSAIRQRLHEVDPGYEITPPEIITQTDTLVVMRGGLMISGITRHALGTGIIQTTKKVQETGEIIEITGFDLSRNMVRAFKSAASDLIPRCAVLFDVGAYLKDIPKDIKTHNALKPWLDEKLKAHHWAFNGGGKQVADKMKALDLTWEDVAFAVEPGRVLRRMSDTLLSVDKFIAGLEHIARMKKLSAKFSDSATSEAAKSLNPQ